LIGFGNQRHPGPGFTRDKNGSAAGFYENRSGLPQSTDEFFFTASNQIVNDLRRNPRHLDTGDQRQASKLAPAARHPLRDTPATEKP